MVLIVDYENLKQLSSYYLTESYTSQVNCYFVSAKICRLAEVFSMMKRHRCFFNFLDGNIHCKYSILFPQLNFEYLKKFCMIKESRKLF